MGVRCTYNVISPSFVRNDTINQSVNARLVCSVPRYNHSATKPTRILDARLRHYAPNCIVYYFGCTSLRWLSHYLSFFLFYKFYILYQKLRVAFQSLIFSTVVQQRRLSKTCLDGLVGDKRNG